MDRNMEFVGFITKMAKYLMKFHMNKTKNMDFTDIITLKVG